MNDNDVRNDDTNTFQGRMLVYYYYYFILFYFFLLCFAFQIIRTISSAYTHKQFKGFVNVSEACKGRKTHQNLRVIVPEECK